jgi:hypothetical protein
MAGAVTETEILDMSMIKIDLPEANKPFEK